MDDLNILKKEQQELFDKIEKLSLQIAKGYYMDEEPCYQDLLDVQLSNMSSYNICLIKRIHQLETVYKGNKKYYIFYYSSMYNIHITVTSNDIDSIAEDYKDLQGMETIKIIHSNVPENIE